MAGPSVTWEQRSRPRLVQGSNRIQILLACVSLVLVTCAVYGPVRSYPFVGYDDPLYLYENPRLSDGLTWHGFNWALTTGLDQWMPVTWIARLALVQFAGLNAGIHHLANLGFHVANTVLVFLILQQLTRSPWRSWLVAGVFALHPLHVESVAWATCLKDVLSLFFGLLTIAAYARYARHCAIRGTGPPSRRGGWYTLTLLLCAVAMMSKPMMATLPVILLLLDVWPLGRTRWTIGNPAPVSAARLLAEKTPFFALSIVTCAVTVWAQHHLGVLPSLSKFPLSVRVANALLSYVEYILKLLWPARLAVFYPLDPGLSVAAAIAAGIGLVMVTAAVVRNAPRVPWLATGWFWYLVTLLPVIGLVQVGSQSMADRYMYLPSIGLSMMVCWSLPDSVLSQRPWKRIAGPGAAAVLVICAGLSRIQVGYWKNSETLFRHALEVTRNNWLAHYNLGVTLEQQGRLDDAIAHYEQAVRIRRDYADAWNNLGGVLARLGRVQEAIPRYQQALRIRPDLAEAHYNLGLALKQVGRVQEAISQYEQALKIKPDYADAYNNLGNILWQTGNVEAAITNYQQAVRLKPHLAEAHSNLGIALMRLGRSREAIPHFEQALRYKSDSAEAHYALGLALEQTGNLADAIGHYDQALRIKPDSTEAQNNLAWLLATLEPAEGGDPARAVTLAERACELTGNRMSAYLDTLAASYAAAGRFDDASVAAQKAVELARSAGQPRVADEIETRLKLYRRGQAYRR
jgi:tetratricopeptide (TPR) repeat protein